MAKNRNEQQGSAPTVGKTVKWPDARPNDPRGSEQIEKDDLRNIGGTPEHHQALVLIVIDNSPSMSGARIGAVYAGLVEALKTLRKVQEEAINVVIKCNVMVFNDEAHWLFSEPVPVDDLVLEPLSTAGRMTDMAGAAEELERVLHKRANGGWMEDNRSMFPSIFLLMSDGCPNVRPWHEEFEALHKNGYFETGDRMGIAIDSESNKEVLAEFTGEMRTVFVRDGRVEIEKAIKQCLKDMVTMSTSMTARKGACATDATAELARELEMEMEDEMDDAGIGLDETDSWHEAVGYRDLDFY